MIAAQLMRAALLDTFPSPSLWALRELAGFPFDGAPGGGAWH